MEKNNSLNNKTNENLIRNKNSLKEIKPELGIEISGTHYNHKLFESLESLNKTYSQRKTAKELNIAHSVLNRRIKSSEEKLGYKLVKTVGSGSELTYEGQKLLNTYKKYQKRLNRLPQLTIAGGHIITGLLETINYNLPFKTLIYSSDDESAYELAKHDIIDILALDDPRLAFENDLNFTAIAYDYLVLVSPGKIANFSENQENPKETIKTKASEKTKETIKTSENKIKEINNVNDLNNLNFIAVKGTAQRLAWNTLKEHGININIEKEVKSQFDAFKIVKNSDNLFTFLNASYFKGNNILKKETKHVISLVPCNNEKKEISEFIEYLLNNCPKKLIKQGFTPITTFR